MTSMILEKMNNDDAYQRWRLTIEYDGTLYHGWQYQDNHATIQSSCEQAVISLTQCDTRIIAAGRTDAGVHALAMTAHIDLPQHKNLSAQQIINGLNFYLHHQDEQITIINAEQTNMDFHARFSAIRRHYQYRILNRPTPSPLLKNRVWHIRQPLDINAMQCAAQKLVGQHDFSSFRATHCQAKTPIKTLEYLHVQQYHDEIHIIAHAPSFLHHQIRNITGCLVDIGKQKQPPAWIDELLKAKNRNLASATAPARGLYFVRAEY